MLKTPPVAITRFTQLKPGELFLSQQGDASYVALAVAGADGDPLMVPLGPGFPDRSDGPSLIGSAGADVISFGKEYLLRLPARPEGWRFTAPDAGTHCIAVTEEGAFIRANFVAKPNFKPCYVGFETGRIVTAGQGRGSAYIEPHGPKAFAIEWELVTREEKPRRILGYPA